MNQSIQILDLLIKIQESSDIFPHDFTETFDGLSLLEVHCIDKIGSSEFANVTKIANDMELTRGSISKTCKKMLAKGLIKSSQRHDNRKEIYYSLTEKGREVFIEHAKCHDQARQKELLLLNTYSEYDQSVILDFLKNLKQLYNRLYINS